MKYVIYISHSMNHKHVNKNPVRPIIKVKPYQKLDIDEEESAKDLPHLQNCRKIHYLTNLLNLQRILYQLKHLKFLQSSAHPDVINI